MNPLTILKVIFTLLPLIHEAVLVAEKLFGAGTGPQKLALAVDKVTNGVQAVLPADAVEHADSIKALVPALVHSVVGILNAHDQLNSPTPKDGAGNAIPAQPSL